MNRKLTATLGVLLMLSIILTAWAPAAALAQDDECPECPDVAGGQRFQLIKDRGYVICGVNQELPGFGYINPEGEFEGFDV
nr:amino acid ABC transporter substrate-binding protein [Ardenticatenia bacterium]